MMNIPSVLKLIAVVFFLMLHSGGVFAADWRSVEGVASRLTWQVDVSSIKKLPNGNLTFWNKFVMTPAIIERAYKNNPEYKMNYSYSLSFWEIDCARRMSNIAHGADYSSAGAVIGNFNSSNSPMEPIIPDSSGDAVAEYVCNLTKIRY